MLVHNINVSLQEYQKKLSMYHKKFVKKNEKQGKVDLGVNLSPQFQYMNVYSSTQKRLKCFDQITQADKNDSESFCGKEGLQGCHYGDASSYENYLDVMSKKL